MMKKLLFSFLLILSISLNLLAQSFYGGLKGGVVASQVSGDQLAGFNKAGIWAGVFTGLKIAEHFNSEVSMCFIQKGSRKNPNFDRGDYSKYLLRLNYVEMPFNFIYTRHNKIHPEFGFSFGILTKTNNVEFNEYGLLPDTEPFRPFEISGNIGFNFILNDNLSAKFYLNNSLTHIRKHKSGSTYWLNTGQFNTALLLGINYALIKN